MSRSISELSGIHLIVDRAFPIRSAHLLPRSDDIPPRPMYVMMLSGLSSIAERRCYHAFPLPSSLIPLAACVPSQSTYHTHSGHIASPFSMHTASSPPLRLRSTFLPSTELTPDTADTSFQSSHIGFFATTLFRPRALSPSNDPPTPSTLPSQPSLFTHHSNIQ